MTFYGPTFPNETHYETLLSGRQRFGNRSANMFFVRPARHIACPRRLKYIHDIKTGYIPYVEDSDYPNRPVYRPILPKINDDDINKTNGLGLYNSADAWRHELMELAQQVKSSLISADEQEQYLRQSRLSRLNKYRHKRTNSITSNYNFEENDEQNVSKRLLYRNVSPRFQRSKITKSKLNNEKSEQEQSTKDENQDPGIWLIPILCYILQIDNIFEAQEWLVNANPTEKRLAMELISRTMQDMQNHDNELFSDNSTSDVSTITSATASSTNINNIYWPYKVLKRQEKDRQQQQEIQNFLKQSKLSSYSPLPSLTLDNNDKCERATSPLRILTPAKRLITTSHSFTPIETTIIEEPSTPNTNDRPAPTIVNRQNESPKTDRPTTLEKRPPSTLEKRPPSTLEKRPPSRSEQRPPSRVGKPAIMNGNDRLSRHSYRVKTSLNNSTDDEAKPISPTVRGKTPLI